MVEDMDMMNKLHKLSNMRWSISLLESEIISSMVRTKDILDERRLEDHLDHPQSDIDSLYSKLKAVAEGTVLIVEVDPDHVVFHMSLGLFPSLRMVDFDVPLVAMNPKKRADFVEEHDRSKFSSRAYATKE